jgi:hypothetical protein
VKSAGRVFVGVAVVATTAVGVVLGTAGQAAARICVDPSTGDVASCPTQSGAVIPPPRTAPPQSVTDNANWTLQWMVFAAAILAGLAIVGVAADVIARRRWSRPPLEAALASSDPAELPRAAGMLGDRFAEQSRAGAAAHAYRAAIDVGHEYWTPIAQVALANLLNEQGERTEAQILLEAAIASGHPRAAAAAQTSLHHLASGSYTTAVASTHFETRQSREAAASAHR